MMNYQYPTTYMLENPDHFSKIGPTPPPMLPSLDQNEIEQTLYQRRVSDANGIEAITDSLQPLQINNYQQTHYQQVQHYSPPAAQRSAPVAPNNVIQPQQAVLFSKTPRCQIPGQQPQKPVMVNVNVHKPSSIDKPPQTPNTPPPPPVLTTSASQRTPLRLNGNVSSAQSARSEVIAITPQSHHGGNSSSNHSTASNNTTATTVIESASHSSHSHHSHSSHHSPINNTPNNNNKLVAPKGGITCVPKIAPPTLANPLPAAQPKPVTTNEQNIIIPLETQQYNALLTQMYGNQVPSINGYGTAATNNFGNIQQVTVQDTNQYNNGYVARNVNNGYTQSTQDIYGAYDTNPYGLYNTPPLPNNNGYYNGTTATNYNPYSQQPNTAPAHILQQPAYNTHAQIPKSAEVHYHGHNTVNNNGYSNGYNTNNNQYGQVQNTQNSYNPYRSPQHHTHSPKSQTHVTTSNTSPHSGVHPHSHSRSSPKSHSHTAHCSHSNAQQQQQRVQEEIAIENLPVHILHRCDGTIISPHSDPMTIQPIVQHHGHGNRNKDEMDAFTAGDDALFGNNMVTLINVNWQTNVPYATVRIHVSNRIHHVPLMDLTHLNGNDQYKLQRHRKGGNSNNNNNNRYRLGQNNKSPKATDHSQQATDGVEIGQTVIRRNPKLSDETLMKLPHLRKHREYIRTIDVNMGPKDYNSYRVSVNSKNNNGSDDDNCDNNGRTANIQNLNAKQPSSNGNNNNGDLNRNNRKKNKRMSACEKGDLFKTELCENWVKKGHCTYGKKCHFAHGRDDIRTRWRIENYKTQPCCDPARADSRLCLFGKRCNYAHPGEPLRRSHHCLYLDEEYTSEILKDYGSTTPYPFGIYI